MNLSVNGQSQVPPGFRFHPTEEELLHYYLKKKVASQKIDLDVIQEVDLNKLEPWDIQEKCGIGSTPQNDWYFFSHKDKKYPTGTRTNRATAVGFWKATGRDKVIRGSSGRIGMRKTLVFYKGRAPHGEKSDWIMHEYRLDDDTHELNVPNLSEDQPTGSDEGWVVCRVFRKKNYVKALHNPTNRSSATSADTHKLSSKTHDLDRILSAMRKTTSTKEESKKRGPHDFNRTTIRCVDNNPSLAHIEKMVPDVFMHLPQLNSPTDHPLPPYQDHGNNSIITSQYQVHDTMINYAAEDNHHLHRASTLNWVELDRLVASQLNGQAIEASESTRQQTCFNVDDNDISPFCLAAGDADGSSDHTTTAINATTTFQDLLCSQSTRVYENEAIDDQFWSFTKQSSSPTSLDPLCHFSV